MPRLPREDARDVVHHVMLRGIERRLVFLDDQDRGDFLARLSRLVPELGFRCFAWVLIPNHVHLVLRSGPVRISRLMARLGTGYARHFNLRHDRVGHLFQNRFLSRRAGDEADVAGLIAYVTRNPLEAGIVADVSALQRFRWCGLEALLGHREPYPFESCGEALAFFGSEPRRARRELLARLGDPSPAATSCPLSLIESPSVPPRESAAGFEAVLREVCSEFGLAEHRLRSRSRDVRVARARLAVAVRSAQELGLSGAEIARRLGLTRAAVSHMLRASRRSGRTI